MTIEKLARATEREFRAIHDEMAGMATKEDLRQMESRLMGAIGEIHEEFEHVYSWLKEHEGRIGFLEKKIA